MSGYIKDHRKELDSDIWIMPPLYHRTWQWLKYNVNHSDNEIPMRDGSKMLIKRGQRLTSVRDIAKGISWYEGTKYKEPNPKTISTILDWMVKTNMILITHGQGNRQYTLITLINYEVYNEKEIQGNSKVTVEKQSADINNNDKNDDNDNKKNNNKPSPRKRPVYEVDSIPFRSASYLLKKIKEHSPGIKEPDIQKWANDMRLMIEADKREPIVIASVIDWATKHDFWQSNILCPAKLRKQFETLQAQMKRGGNSGKYGRGDEKPFSKDREPEISDTEMDELFAASQLRMQQM